MNTQHTPGPWMIGYGRSYRNTGIYDGKNPDPQGNQNMRSIFGPTTRIANLEEAESFRPQERVDADAALIAAAPDLLAALLRVVSCPAMWEDEAETETTEAILQAYEAYQKATGTHLIIHQHERSTPS